MAPDNKGDKIITNLKYLISKYKGNDCMVTMLIGGLEHMECIEPWCDYCRHGADSEPDALCFRYDHYSYVLA